MMKRILIGLLISLIAIGGADTVSAGHMPSGDSEGHNLAKAGGQSSLDWRMVKTLKLSDSQQLQIKTIVDTERIQVDQIASKRFENTKLLMQIAEALVFDEAVVRELANRQGQIEAEMIVTRMKVQNQVNAVLTADQRELLARSLRSDLEK